MPKDAYYFPHDSNAHRDPKCSALLKDFGAEGYGLYWAIIEILHEQGGKLEKFPKLYDGLSFQLQISKEALTKQMEAMVADYRLLQEDEKHIWSERVLRNLEERKLKYESKVIAGRIGGIQSGISRSKTKQNEAPLEANEQKERKGKESKLNIYSKGFDGFWLAYPRKENKPAALRAFSKINPDEPTLEAMLKSIAGSKKSEGWLQDNGKYIPLPASWLNGRRWEDVVTRPVERPISFRAD